MKEAISSLQHEQAAAKGNTIREQQQKPNPQKLEKNI